jgi:hypothetical protein
VKDNTLLLVVALALAIAGGVIGFTQKSWAVVLIGAAAAITALVLLF